jgi:hypothetical protein
MRLTNRSIPVLEGAAARRFERLARKAEKERGTIDVTEAMKRFQEVREDARKRGIFI